jgi:predicted TIM-barrel fold metal-dependent hydrolase
MKRVAELAEKYPNVKIVLDHVGFPKPEVSATYGLSPEHMALAKHKNVYYKFTTLLMDMLDEAKVPNKDFLSYAVSVYGADHFVWGSDVGNSEGEYSSFVQRAMNAAGGLSPMQQKALFHDTAVKVFVPGGRAPART